MKAAQGQSADIERLADAQRVPRSPVTVLVVSYNHESYVRECLESIEKQSLRAARVIVADDCSTDDTPSIIRAYQCSTSMPLTFYGNDRNQGLTVTLAKLLAEVDTEYFTYISADDFMLPQRLEAQVSSLDHEAADLSYSDAIVVGADSSVIHSTSTIEFPWPEEPKLSDDLLESLLYANWIPAASIMMRTACFRRIGGYNPAVFYEDYELLTRAAAKGLKFSYIRDALVAVRRLPTSMSAVRFGIRELAFLRARDVALQNFPSDASPLAGQVAAVRWALAKRIADLERSRWTGLQQLWRTRRGASSAAALVWNAVKVLASRHGRGVIGEA